MLVTLQELNTVVDQYKLDAMTDNTPEISLACLRAAEAKVLSYLATRYDIAAIQALPSDALSLADLKEIIKDIALYYIMRRHNVDMAFDRVVAMYREHTAYLSDIARAHISLPSLPPLKGQDGKPTATLAMGSRPKKDFEY